MHDFSSIVNATDEKQFECVGTTTRPNIKICLYPDNVDVYVSASIRARGCWENSITVAINDAMNLYRGATFIDIGSNLGIHSLVTARNRHNVIAVEPKWSSVQRFHKSVNMNRLADRILLLQNAVSNRREELVLYSDDTNQGAASLRFPLKHKEIVRSILMDDLLEVLHTNVAIIKMDIQGSEYRALMNATELFASVKIPAIFMEFEEMAKFLRIFKTTEGVYVREMVASLRRLGYKPYPLDNPYREELGQVELQDKNMKTWPINVVWTQPELVVFVSAEGHVQISKMV